MLGEERVSEAQEQKERDALVVSSEMGGGGRRNQMSEQVWGGWKERGRHIPAVLEGEAIRGVNREDRRKDAVVSYPVLSYLGNSTQARG